MKRCFHGKAGFTLPEMIISILFVVVIITVSTYIWYLSNQSLRSAEAVSEAYGEARSVESLIQNAASVSPSLKFTVSPLSGAYSHFYFDNSSGKPIYTAVFYGNTDVGTPVTAQFPDLDSVTFSVRDLGRRCILDYVIASNNTDGPFYIKGGVVLNNIDSSAFSADNPGGALLSGVLNFAVPAPPEVIQ